ncbi:hypothetical protein CHUAL_010741 [Chamberlinius hualienensis]
MAESQEARNNKKKFMFTVERDVVLLKVALQENPWQLGDKRWAEISTIMTEHFATILTRRTVKDRVNLLIQKYQTHQLISKTGTEEVISERGKLIEECIMLMEEATPTTNIEIGAFNADNSSSSNLSPVPFQSLTEKGTLDLERDLILEYNSPPEPSDLRQKRIKLCPEDDLIKQKHEHDMLMEKERFELEKLKTLHEFEIENQKLELENKRESRLEEEGKRRDEIMVSRNKMLELMLQLIAKK